MRDQIKDESVDLIYLDPPFNSNANYNLLFKNAGGQQSEAQVEAFKDTWEWGPSAAYAYDEVMKAGGEPALVLSALRKWLGNDSAMMAYLAMMAVRLIELNRKLKSTGSLFLHCDPTASHYLKLMLDAIFGHKSFKNEIIWSYRRWPTKANRLQRMHDVIFYYSPEPDEAVFNVLYQEPTASSLKRWKGKKQKASFDLLGHRNPTAELSEESSGVPLNDVWPISVIAPVSKERIGYPTQKPVALLERIIKTASNEDAVILDPFCGCGTTIDAAENLNRHWIGIDVTHYAVSLIERRLATWHPKATYSVHGRPTDLAGAVELARRDKHQFQWWASWRLGAQRYREDKKGADRGIDGRAQFKNGPYGDGWIIISVKGGENIGVKDIRDLRGVIEREETEMGILVTLAQPTGPMVAEAAGAGFVRKSAHGRLPRLQIVTVEDMLNGIMPKLPPLPQIEHGPLPVRRKKGRDQMELLFSVAGTKKIAEGGEVIDPRYLRLG